MCSAGNGQRRPSHPRGWGSPEIPPLVPTPDPTKRPRSTTIATLTVRTHGRRHGQPMPPARPLTSAEVNAVAAAGPKERRALAYIGTIRLLTGKAPTAVAVWSVFQYGTPDRMPSGRKRVPHTRRRRDGRVRTEMVTEHDHVRLVLWHLRPYGVRWRRVAPERSARIARPIYVHVVKPALVASMAADGVWPPRVRYRGPRAGK